MFRKKNQNAQFWVILLSLVFLVPIIIYSFIVFVTSHETISQNDSFVIHSQLDNLAATRFYKVKTIVLSKLEDKVIVNGEENPIISIRPGETQRWKIKNITEGSIYNLTVSNFPFLIIARDGFSSSQKEPQTEEILAPGDSVEILIKGPFWGSYDVMVMPIEKVLNIQTEKIATLKSEGMPVFNQKFSAPISNVENFSEIVPSLKRRFMFTQAVDSGKILLNGRNFSGTLDASNNVFEEWLLVNKTSDWIPFQAIVPFQVLEVNSEPVAWVGFDQVFTIPARGLVKIMIKEEN